MVLARRPGVRNRTPASSSAQSTVGKISSSAVAPSKGGCTMTEHEGRGQALQSAPGVVGKGPQGVAVAMLRGCKDPADGDLDRGGQPEAFTSEAGACTRVMAVVAREIGRSAVPAKGRSDPITAKPQGNVLAHRRTSGNLRWPRGCPACVLLLASACRAEDSRPRHTAAGMLLPSLADRVVLPKNDPLLASIATCLLLQASILGTGWLLQGWCARTEPLQGQAASPAQPHPASNPQRPPRSGIS